MEWLILLVLIALVVLAMLAKQRNKANEFLYQKNGPLFSEAERSFYGVLNQAVMDSAVVFGKVRVADVLSPTKGMDRKSWQKAFNRISSKHFDYIICEPGSLSVLAAVELDDKSHNSKNRAERDQFLESACDSAGVELFRFKAAVTYNIDEIRSILFPSQEEQAQQGQPTDVNVEGEPIPLCPKCLSPLAKRVAKKGDHKGSEFLACSAFPKCRYIEK